MVLFAVAAMSVVTAAGCGRATDTGHRSDFRSGPLTVQAEASVSGAMPQDFGSPTFIAGDPSGTGVFTWNGTANSSDSVCHVDGSGTVTCWPVLTGSANTGERGASGFAVSGSAVWLGINSEVVELDTSTGKVTTWTVPTPRNNSVAQASQGPRPIPQAVQALAVSPQGQVAVGLSFSSSVEVLDPSTGNWTQIPLPGVDDEPITVGYSAAGSLGAGFANLDTHLSNGLLIAPASGPAVTATVGDAWSVLPYGAASFLVGAGQPDMVSPDGTAVQLNTPPGPLDPLETARPASLPGDKVAFTTTGGVIDFRDNAASPASATAGATSLALPEIPCQQPPGPPPSPAPGSTPTPAPAPTGLCPPEIMLMTTDGAGNIWIVTEDQQSMVQLVTP